MGNTNKEDVNMIAWKIYKKSDGCHVETVWYQPGVTAQEVYRAVADDFDFEVLVKEVEAE